MLLNAAWLGTTAALMSMGAGWAQPSQTSAPATPVITQPDYKAVPRLDRMFYPKKAREMGVTGGTASMRCVVTPRGKLKNCQIVSEDPPDVGFGDAELALGKYFELKPMIVDGKSVEAEVTVPIRFDLR